MSGSAVNCPNCGTLTEIQFEAMPQPAELDVIANMFGVVTTADRFVALTNCPKCNKRIHVLLSVAIGDVLQA